MSEIELKPASVFECFAKVNQVPRPSKREEKMIEFIRNEESVNPKEFARNILGEVLKCSGEMPLDDMTIMVIGIWRI